MAAVQQSTEIFEEQAGSQGQELALAVPVYFGPAQASLFGFYHAPADGWSASTGVVLCNPLGYEAMCAHRTYRALAERLAAAGVPALRFDYHGTGNSAGYPNEPDRMHAWGHSVEAAIAEMRDRAGVESVALFGVRFGATLAAKVAGERGDVGSVVLWAPCASGRAYVRELRAFGMLRQPNGGVQRPQSGGEEAAGYLFDAQTVADLLAVDLTASPTRIAERALIVSREDLPGSDPRLARHLESAGVAVGTLVDGGYARMMRDPQETIVPVSTLDAVVGWLREGGPARRAAAPRIATPSARNLLAASGTNGTAVTEQTIRFGEGSRLFGIAAHGPDRLVEGLPAVLFLNVGANHHVGPNRMYVSLARDLAGLGYASLRFDVGGLGDSSVPPGAPDNRLYSKDSVGDVKEAMDLVARRFGADRFVLLGLCSGAYLAFHTSVEDPRVVGQVLLNPQTFEWKDGDSLELSVRKSFLSTRYYMRALFNPSVWKRAIRGDVNVRGVAGVLRERMAARARAEARRIVARIRGKQAPRTEVERAFHAMCERGVDTLLVFSFNDGGLDMIEGHLGSNLENVRRHRNIRMEIVEGADHTFTPVDSQVALYALLRKHVRERFA